MKRSGIGGMLNMFTGGAISRMVTFRLIMPYISAGIIDFLDSAALSVHCMNRWGKPEKNEGEMGRRKLNQYTVT